MNALLESLEPKTLWSYFLELSKIPRGSKSEAAAAAKREREKMTFHCDPNDPLCGVGGH